MIPDEAVEAAAAALFQVNQHDDAWADEFPNYLDYLRAEATKALEAAAPFIAADAWDEGWKSCSDWDIYIDMGGDEPNTDNPYGAIVQQAVGQNDTTGGAEIDDDPDMGEPMPPAHLGEDVVEMSHPTIDWSITTIRKNVRVYLDDGWYLVDDPK